MKRLLFLGILLVSSLYAKHIKDPLATKLQHMVKRANIKNKNIIFRQRKEKNNVIKAAKKYLGAKYVYGANSRRAVDCSGFVQRVFRENKIKLPRTSKAQYKIGIPISKKNLQPGDLVFFSSTKTNFIAHVGIYIGFGNFIHASSARKKVVITKLNQNYYKCHYKGARRL